MTTKLMHTESQQAEAIKIGQRLSWARVGQGMSKRQLATHLGINRGMVLNMERGLRMPSVFLAMSLCHVLGISPQYLLWGTLQGIEEGLLVKLARDHPELLLAEEMQHVAKPNPGPTRKSSRNSARAAIRATQ